MPVCEKRSDEYEYNEVCGAVKRLNEGLSPGPDKVAV